MRSGPIGRRLRAGLATAWLAWATGVAGQALSPPSAPAAAAASASAAPAASAASAASRGAASPAAAASSPHLHTQIRQAHLTRLQERLQHSPEHLRQQCRYESEIATPPPAGLVALTFDDGPHPVHTPQILEVLARHEIPATFFLIGEKMQQHPELVQRLLSHPQHRLGSHSWSHPNFHALDEAAQQAEILRGLEQLPAVAEPAARLYRYPFGNATCFANDLLHERGVRIAGWHVDSCDWAFDHDGSVALHEAVSCGVDSRHRSDFVGHVAAAVRHRQGGIVLLHEIHPRTLAQLDELITALKEQGLRFVTLDDPRLVPSLR